MVQRCAYIPEEIIKFDLHCGLCRRHREKECVLECLAKLCGLLCRLPFLEKGRERLHVYDLSGSDVCHADLAVSLYRYAVEIDSPSCPSVETVQPLERNLRRLIGT